MQVTKTTVIFWVLGLSSLLISIEAIAQEPTETRLPATYSGEPLADEMIITVTSEEVRVNLDRGVAVLDGDVPPAARVSSLSPIVVDLQNVIENALHDEARWAMRRDGPQNRTAALAADRDTSYQLLTNVMMTASASGVQYFSFITVDAGWGELWGPDLDTTASSRPPLQRLLIHSPQNSGRIDRWGDDEAIPPRVLIAITEDGFTISDLTQSESFRASGMGDPLEGCGIPTLRGSLPVTVCARNGAGRLVDQMDYRRLYNRLVQIRTHADWAELWDENNSIINIVAERETPLDVVLRVIDVSQTVRSQTDYSDDTDFQTDSDDSSAAPLFPRPVLLLPRSAE